MLILTDSSGVLQCVSVFPMVTCLILLVDWFVQKDTIIRLIQPFDAYVSVDVELIQWDLNDVQCSSQPATHQNCRQGLLLTWNSTNALLFASFGFGIWKGNILIPVLAHMNAGAMFMLQCALLELVKWTIYGAKLNVKWWTEKKISKNCRKAFAIEKHAISRVWLDRENWTICGKDYKIF